MKAITLYTRQLCNYVQGLSLTKAVLLIAALGASTYVGCAESEFENTPSRCEGESPVDDCQRKDSGNLEYTINMKTAAQVDVLFVNDNSGSMSTEQNKMANAFGGFIDSLRGLDYQIAMITTDLSVQDQGAPAATATARAANGGGSYQDGVFLFFDTRLTNVLRYNTGTAAERAAHQRLFENTVKRQETLTCEAKSYNEEFCPSRDERAIYATHLAFERNQRAQAGSHRAAFFRPKSHLAVVILSDEDERGRGRQSNSERPLQAKDLPANLVQQFNIQFNEANFKSLSVHAVVIRPDDTACFDAQNAQFSKPGYHNANYGHVYAELVRLTNGHLGDICADNYTRELGSIADHIQLQSKSIGLRCEPAEGSLQVQIVQDGTTSAASANQYTLQGDTLELQNLPTGADLKVRYECQGYR